MRMLEKDFIRELSELRARVATLEAVHIDEATKRLDLQSGEHALREAILQFTQEVAVRDGVALELFVERFHAAMKWHRDRFLRMVETVNPELAAEIDERNLDDVPTEDLPPCILQG